MGAAGYDPVLIDWKYIPAQIVKYITGIGDGNTTIKYLYCFLKHLGLWDLGNIYCINSSVKLAADWILGIHIYESAAKCKIGSRLNIGISYFQDWVNLVWGPCLRSLFFLVPCQGYVWTVWWPFLLSFTSGPDRDLKFSRLSQHGPRPMSKECVLFGTMSGLFVDCVGTMFSLALLQNHLEL